MTSLRGRIEKCVRKRRKAMKACCIFHVERRWLIKAWVSLLVYRSFVKPSVNKLLHFYLLKHSLFTGHRTIEALRRTRDAQQEHLGPARSHQLREKHAGVSESFTNSEEDFCAASTTSGRRRRVTWIQREFLLEWKMFKIKTWRHLFMSLPSHTNTTWH